MGSGQGQGQGQGEGEGLRLASAAPADSFAYLSFAGLAAASQAAEQLSLWKLWQEPQVQALFAPLVERYATIAEAVPAQQQQHWDLFEELASGRIEVVARGYGLAWDRDEPLPMPGIVVALDLRGNRQQFDGMLERQLAELDGMLERDGGRRRGMPAHTQFQHQGTRVDVVTTPGRPAIDVYTARYENLFLLGLTRALFLEVLGNLQGGGGERLASAPSFGRARAKLRTEPLIEAWVNVDAITSRISGLLPDEALAAVRALGLDAITSLYYASTIRDGDSFDTLYVDAPEPRRGLLRARPDDAIDLAALRSVPQTALYATLFRLDLAHAWDVLWQAAENVVPPAQLQMARRQVARVEQRLGFAIRDDALAALGRAFTMFVDLPPNSMVPSFVVQATLADEGKTRDVLAKVVQLSRAQVRDVQHRDQTLHLITVPGSALSPCYAFVGGKLMLSATLPGLRAAVNQATTGREADGGGLAAQETFQRTFEGMDLAGATALEYFDAPRVAAWGYGFAETFVPSLAGAAQDLPIDPLQMPPREVIVGHLHGFGGVARCESDGMLYRARTFGLGAIAALGSAFLLRAPGVPPQVLERLGRELERESRSQLRPRRVVVRGEDGDAVAAAPVPLPAETPSQIVNPLPPGDPREQELESELGALDRRVARDPENGSLYFTRGLVRSQLRRYDEAAADYEKARELGHNLATSAYNIACVRSLQGQKDEALEWLGKALDEGFSSWNVLDHDSDLDAIRKEPRFGQVVGKYRR